MKKIIVLFFLAFFACSKKQRESFDQKAIEKNNEAVQLLSLGIQDSNAFYALKLYDEAIGIDSTYYLAYAHKAQLLCQMGRYQDASMVLEEAIRVRPQFVEGIIVQGFLYEKLKDSNNADDKFNKAIAVLDERIAKGTYSLLNEQLLRAFVNLILDKKIGKQMLDEVISSNPTYSDSTLMRQIFENFDRGQYALDFCGGSIMPGTVQ